MVVTISLNSDAAKLAGRASDPEHGGTNRVLLAPNSAKVGVVATVEDRGVHPDGTPILTIRALQRARLGSGTVDKDGVLLISADVVGETETTPEIEALAKTYRATATNLLTKVGAQRLVAGLQVIDSPSALADSIAYWPQLSSAQRLELLETIDVAARLALATRWLKEALADALIREEVNASVSDELDEAQRKAILRRQLASIQKELGEDTTNVIDEYRAKVAELEISDKVREAIEPEIDRLERTSEESAEASWLRTWLDTVLDIPWNERSADNFDLDNARQLLDADHTGLDDVKDRLVEYLAVRKLRAERDVVAGARNGIILSLVGPPGVGKTSLGESIAAALNRKFVRVALGGIRDEAEIRGHRRTYVGARPGRIVRAIQEAGAMNPVILLDEIDKVGSGWQGDPSSALLEVLDPAQNNSFRDHYLEFELDLSDVIFIATANTLETIPGPLLDRLEVIPVEGYTEREKAEIARTHLVPKLVTQNGLTPDEVTITDETLAAIVGDYTREAGVRRLERLIDKTLRKSATKIAVGEGPLTIEPDQLSDLLGRAVPRDDIAGRITRPGIVTGLAVTGAGGDVLLVEAALVPGTGEPIITGQLGDVMKESATIAQSVVASTGRVVPEGYRLHIHFPAGAVPKDGPSAGIALCTALTSLLDNTLVRPSVAMTGEVTLHGKVLPIGGVKQKVLAAHRAGVKEVLLPKANGPDIDDIPDDVLDEITIHMVDTIDDVLSLALT